MLPFYVDLDPDNLLAIVSHVHLQKKHKRYKRVAFNADDLLSMNAAELDESAPIGYRATGNAVKVGNIYQREYVDQTPEEAQRQKTAELAATDAKMARVSEDLSEQMESLLDILIEVGVLSAEQRPVMAQAAQDVIADRKAKRSAL